MLSYTLLVTTCLWSAMPFPQPANDVPVLLEVVAESGLAVDGQQQWMRMLQDREFGLTHVRMRSSRGSEQPGIENRGSDSAPRYTVTAVLTPGGRLALPGLELRYGQRQQLATWLDKLRSGGTESVTAQPGAYGLTKSQLTTLQTAVKKPVAMSTKDQPAREVLAYLQRTLGIDIQYDNEAQSILTSSEKVPDELQGIACGTALAAVARPFGLLVTPTGQGTRQVGLRLTKKAQQEDAWPVGRRAASGAADLAPALLTFIKVQIVDQPLADTLNSIQQRLEIPFLYDHNLLARDGVDLQTPVSIAPRKTFYKKILDELLFQKMLVCELRTDDAGEPFLWITSAKR